MDPRFTLACPACGRHGFVRARPRCQYCGVDLPDAPEFVEVRARLDAIYRETEEVLHRVREARPGTADVPVDGSLPAAADTACGIDGCR